MSDRKEKRPRAKAAMESAKTHMADGMSLEAALEAALSELELPSGDDEDKGRWMDTPYPSSYVPPKQKKRERPIEPPYPTGKDPRYD